MLIRQDSDPTLPNFKNKVLGLLFDDARYMQYS